MADDDERPVGEADGVEDERRWTWSRVAGVSLVVLSGLVLLAGLLGLAALLLFLYGMSQWGSNK